jgi:hypothetical protein
LNDETPTPIGPGGPDEEEDDGQVAPAAGTGDGQVPSGAGTSSGEPSARDGTNASGDPTPTASFSAAENGITDESIV